ncbi:MAG: GNAT family N-acetyltransferase [Chloroflexota bacterium]|nr:GNAT family N-acetyltransferase [Chloroflexota bacterium]
MHHVALGEPLSLGTLARRETLPVKPEAVILGGERVRLAPLELDRDVETLHALSNGKPARIGQREVGAYDPDALVWRYMFGGPFSDADALAAYLRVQVETPDGLCLCVHDAPSDTPIGVVNFVANSPQHLKVEIAGVWYSPLAQRTGANTEATYLMLLHAFGLGYRRVEWKCDSLNARSRAAALRMGFTFEGIQEAHYIVKGRNRDTAWFRILDREWDAVRTHLEALLMREPLGQGYHESHHG